MRLSMVGLSPNFTNWLHNLPLTAPELNKIENAMTKEYRWYIIGKYCEREKYNRKNNETVQDLLTRLGQDIGCSEPTIRRFVSYFKAIDYLQSIVPDAVAEILAGEIEMSVENVRNLARRSYKDILDTLERIKSGKERVCDIFPERAVRPKIKPFDKQHKNATETTVKDVPKYDPDAQVTGLTYTIPSWVSAIDRIFMNDNIYAVSKTARKKLIKELSVLKETIDLMMDALSEKKRRKDCL